jgi:hypothetical protein
MTKPNEVSNIDPAPWTTDSTRIQMQRATLRAHVQGFEDMELQRLDIT